MSSYSELRYFSDRMLVSDLRFADNSVFELLHETGRGFVNNRDTVHFCGLVSHPDVGSVFFLPRESITTDTSINLATAKLTMKALSKFAAETSKREFESNSLDGDFSILSVIKHITDDFIKLGIYTQRSRLGGREHGKPNWTKTIQQETPILNFQGQPIYSDIHTTVLARRSDAILAQIQTAILREIITSHGWWIAGLGTRKHELFKINATRIPRALWEKTLTSILPSLYSSRSIFLAEYLRRYLRETRGFDTGKNIFGINDFHTVWEAVLRKAIVRSETDPMRNWNSELPKPVYLANGDDKIGVASRGMQTDIILEIDDAYVIVDAKYYSAKSASDAPGWSDIVKQMFYELALHEVLGIDDKRKRNIKNVFVFPNQNNGGPLRCVEMKLSDGSQTSRIFPKIDCIYVSITEALNSYVSGTPSIQISL